MEAYKLTKLSPLFPFPFPVFPVWVKIATDTVVYSSYCSLNTNGMAVSLFLDVNHIIDSWVSTLVQGPC